MKSFKLVTILLLGIASLGANAVLSSTPSTAISSIPNSVSLPSSIPSSAVLSVRKSSLPLAISSFPSPLNLLSAISLSSF